MKRCQQCGVAVPYREEGCAFVQGGYSCRALSVLQLRVRVGNVACAAQVVLESAIRPRAKVAVLLSKRAESD